MTTTRDIITSALRRIRIVSLGANETPSAEEASHCLAALNDMMHGWAAQGVDLKHSDLALGDTFWFFVPPAGVTGDLVAALASQGTWNASTNTPTLATGTGTLGHYYTVSVPGSTVLDDVTSWAVNDVAVFDGTEWLKGQSSRKHEGAIVDLLAVEVANDFGKEPSATLQRSAQAGWIALQADFIIPNTATWDNGLVRTMRRTFETL